MKSRAQHLLLVGAAVIAAPPILATRFEEFNLRLRPEIQHELNYLADNDFASPRSASSILSSPSKCSSPLVEWSNEKIHEMGYITYKELFDNQILQMPYIYKHYIDKNEHEEYFGYNGDQTKELIARHDHTMSFWTEADVDNSIQTNDILLLSMHGSDLMDNEKLVPTITRMFQFDSMDDILAFASTVQDYVRALPGGADNPLLTMNAVATRAAVAPGMPPQSADSIIIGDGVLQFLVDSKMTSSGPDFVHAHEFGHHIQFVMDMAVPPGSGYENDTRRKEMMADAIAAYFLAHDRGGNMAAEEINEFTTTSFSTGDCSISNEDHHGTPTQRKCAAIWGASQAAPNLPLVDPEAFVRRFDQAYLKMLALDSQDCTLVLEDPTLDEVVTDEYNAVESQGVGQYQMPETSPSDVSNAPGDVISMVPLGRNPTEGISDTSLTSESTNDSNYGDHVAPLAPLPHEDANPIVINKSRGPPAETRKYNMVTGTVGYSSRDCSLPWVYCSPEMQAASSAKSLVFDSKLLVSMIPLAITLFFC